MELKKSEIIQMVISKAWEDSKYKKFLLEDPIRAIEELTGVKVVVPEGKTLVVNDQTDKAMVHINIPPEPEIENMELSEEQLETIAGGRNPIWNDLADSIFPKRK